MTWLCAAAVLVLHLGWGPRYPVFRDELYYLACADHLAWGYVDHPPLSIFILAAWTSIAGDSLLSLRILPSLAAAAVVLLTAALTGALGGGRFPQTLAGLAVLAAPTMLGITGFYSMNAFDLVFWLLAAHLVVRLSRQEAPRARLWLLLGAVIGLGLLNKLSAAPLAAGIAVATLLTPLRRDLRTPAPWLASGLAFLLIAPHVAWQVMNGWPTLEFIRNASAFKNVSLGPAGFLLAQVRDIGPLNALFWMPGLVWLAVGSNGRHRALAIVFVVSYLAFMNGKAYYLVPAMLLPLAAGPVSLERVLARPRIAMLRPAMIGLLLLAAAVPLPIVVPLLPPGRLAGYMNAIGIEPEQAERSELGVLPQHFADRFGWEELTAITARAWHSLTPDEQGRAVIVTSNYGEAGAIDYYGRALGLPRATSPHNNYFLWGPGNPDATIVIAVGYSPEGLARSFDDVRTTTALSNAYAMPYEREHPVAICRNPRSPWRELWEKARRFI